MVGMRMADVNCALMLVTVVGCAAAIGLLLQRALGEEGRPKKKVGRGILWLIVGLGGFALFSLILLLTMDIGTDLPKG